jgi:uridine kinase
MHFPASKDALAAALLVISAAPTRCGTTKVVAIDGPSGGGKTDCARALAARMPDTLVLHMDDLYPGWEGLMQAIDDLHDQVLAPLASGRQATYRRWDWEHGRYGEQQALPATALLLVEGVGSGAKPGSALESALIWLEADRDERFRRAMQRDGESYLPHWQRWAAHEDALFALDTTRSRADLIINTSP